MRAFLVAVLVAFSVSLPAYAQKGIATSPASVTRAGAASQNPKTDGDLLHGILDVLSDAVITHLDARVSLESGVVERARVRVRNLTLRDLKVGVLLSARGTQKLAELTRDYKGDKSNPLTPILEIARLGLFNRIEVELHLTELSLKRLDIDADNLDIRGLLLKVGATPPDASGKVTSDTLEQILNILRNTALNKVSAHAGLDRLSAKRIRVAIQGATLQGFGVSLSLARDDARSEQKNSPSGTQPVSPL